METEKIYTDASLEESRLLKGEIRELSKMVMDFFESRPQTHEHFVTILGYAVEILFSSYNQNVNDDDGFDVMSRRFAKYLSVIHEDVCRLRREMNEKYS